MNNLNSQNMLSPEYPKEQLEAKVEYPSPDKLLSMEEAEANKELAKTIKHIADLPQKELEGAVSDFIDHLLHIVETDPATNKAIPSYDFWTKTISGVGNDFEKIVNQLSYESAEKLHQKIDAIQRQLLTEYDKEYGIKKSFLIRKVKALTPIGLKLFYELDKRDKASKEAKQSVKH